MTRPQYCVLGDSHLAALKSGWDETGQKNWNADLSFFGARGNLMRRLKREGRTLVGATEELQEQLKLTSGGRDYIPVDEFEFFFVYALGFGLEPLLRHNARVRSDQHLGASAYEFVISQERFIEEVSKLVENSIAFRTIRMIRRMVDRPVVLVSQPLPVTAIRTRENPEWPFWSEVEEFARVLHPILEEHATRFARKFDVKILHQPDHTVTDGYFTSQEYRRPWTHKRLPGLKLLYRTPDFTHVNARFGASLVDMFMNAAGAQPRSPD